MSKSAIKISLNIKLNKEECIKLRNKSLDNNKSNSKFLNLSIYNQTENKIPQHIIASSDYFFSSCKKPEKFRFFSNLSTDKKNYYNLFNCTAENYNELPLFNYSSSKSFKRNERKKFMNLNNDNMSLKELNRTILENEFDSLIVYPKSCCSLNSSKIKSYNNLNNKLFHDILLNDSQYFRQQNKIFINLLDD